MTPYPLLCGFLALALPSAGAQSAAPPPDTDHDVVVAEAGMESLSATATTIEILPEPLIAGVPILDVISSASPRYLPVTYTGHYAHASRLNMDCQTCHHDMQGGEPASCSQCHDQPGLQPSLTDALHQTCRGCHRELLASNPQSPAPTDCLGCHTQRP